MSISAPFSEGRESRDTIVTSESDTRSAASYAGQASMPFAPGKEASMPFAPGKEASMPFTPGKEASIVAPGSGQTRTQT